MERLRVTERKLLRTCVNYRRSYDNYLHISNSELYERASITRIDSHLLNAGVKTLDSWPNSEIMQQCIINDIEYLEAPQHRFKPTWYLKLLSDRNQLYDGSVPIYYHRRFRTNPHPDNIVYNIRV